MIGALLYLRVTSLKNWLLSSARRLRQPKYLAGAVVGVAYFWFFFFRPVMPVPVGRPGLPNQNSPEFEALPLTFIFVPFGIIAIIRLIAAWIAPTNKPGLAFAEAEVAFLFPAPMTRRMLVHYKLLSTQFTILLSSLMVALISSHWGARGSSTITHAIGWWVMFSTLNLHTTGAAFTVARLIDGGVSKRQRQLLVTAVIVLLIAAARYTVWRNAPPPTHAQAANPLALLHYATGLTNIGVLYWLALPFKIMLGPFLAIGWREFLPAFGPALLVLAAHYLWVLRAETSFEEASIALAEKRARTIALMRAGNYRFGQAEARARRGPFLLAPAGGRPEVAFLWKNLLTTRPYLNYRVFLVCAGFIVAGNAWLANGSEVQRTGVGVAGALALILAGYTLLLGPHFARQDLRSDLENSDLLKMYPLRGWQVMLGELLAPVVILTGILWLAILAAVLGLGALKARTVWLSPEFRLTAALCLALGTPLLCALQLMVPNAATLLFPSWARAVRTRERGIDVMGQRVIFFAGQLVVLVITLFPAVLLGVLLWFAAHWLLGEAASTAVATVGVIAVLVLEVSLGLLWLGRLFEKFDLSTETAK